MCHGDNFDFDYGSICVQLLGCQDTKALALSLGRSMDSEYTNPFAFPNPPHMPALLLSNDEISQAGRKVARTVVDLVMAGELSRHAFCRLARNLEEYDPSSTLFLKALIIAEGGGAQAFEQYLRAQGWHDPVYWMCIAVPPSTDTMLAACTSSTLHSTVMMQDARGANDILHGFATSDGVAAFPRANDEMPNETFVTVDAATSINRANETNITNSAAAPQTEHATETASSGSSAVSEAQYTARTPSPGATQA